MANGWPIAAPAALSNEVALHQSAVVADDGGRPYHCPLGMVENQTLANNRSARDLSARKD